MNYFRDLLIDFKEKNSSVTLVLRSRDIKHGEIKEVWDDYIKFDCDIGYITFVRLEAIEHATQMVDIYE